MLADQRVDAGSRLMRQLLLDEDATDLSVACYFEPNTPIPIDPMRPFALFGGSSDQPPEECSSRVGRRLRLFPLKHPCSFFPRPAVNGPEEDVKLEELI